VVECLAAPLQAQVVVAFLGLECLVVPLLGLVVVAFLVAECQNQVCLAVLSLVPVKMLVELDLAAHKMSRVQLEL
jgi:hypothetical protein